jgi:outer membrane lipoprotein SlyB
MPRLALLFALLLLIPALPLRQAAAAEAPRPAQVSSVTAALPEMPRISAGHAAALGTGLFVGAFAGSVMINGGAFAAAIGAVAGVLVGNWYWTERVEPQD